MLLFGASWICFSTGQISVIRQRAPPVWVDAKGVHKNICACRSETCAHKHTESTGLHCERFYDRCLWPILQAGSNLITPSSSLLYLVAQLKHTHTHTEKKENNSRFLWLFPVKFKLAGCNMIKLNSIMWPQKTSSSTGCVAFAEIPESSLV